MAILDILYSKRIMRLVGQQEVVHIKACFEFMSGMNVNLKCASLIVGLSHSVKENIRSEVYTIKQ